MRDRPSEAASSPGASGDEIEPGGVGGAHDHRQPHQRRRRQAEFLDHHVEGAAFAAMAPEHVLDVEGRGVESLADRQHLGRRDEQEYGVRIDEAADQPRAGDAVDLRPRAGDPDRAALRVARRQFRAGPAAVCLLPGFEAAFQSFGRDIEHGAARPPCPALSFSPRMADRRWPGRPVNSPLPLGGLLVAAPDRAGNQPRIGGEILIGSDVDQGRACSACRSGAPVFQREIVVYDDMNASSLREQDAILGHVASWGDRKTPIDRQISEPARAVNALGDLADADICCHCVKSSHCVVGSCGWREVISCLTPLADHPVRIAQGSRTAVRGGCNRTWANGRNDDRAGLELSRRIRGRDHPLSRRQCRPDHAAICDGESVLACCRPPCCWA